MVSQTRPLIEVLAEIPEFRSARGKCHALVAILAPACSAMLWGYRSYTATACISIKAAAMPHSTQPSIGVPHCGPTNPFVPFPKEAIEQSVPARFEQREQLLLHGGSGAVSWLVPNPELLYMARQLLYQQGDIGLLEQRLCQSGFLPWPPPHPDLPPRRGEGEGGRSAVDRQ